MCPPADPDGLYEFENVSFETALSVPDADSLFRALSHTHRRRLLATLVSTDRSSVTELVDVLAGWASTDGGPVGPDDWDALRTQLRHSHLPMLDEAGLVDYDPEAGTVTLASVPEPVTGLVTFATAYERTTSELTDTEAR
jgi:DNA-binding transcriptional ArsR family regulator